MAYQRILVAIDLSEEAEEVIAAAKEQVRLADIADPSNGVELHFINVIKPLKHTHGGLDIGAVSATANLDQLLLERATEIVGRWANDTGLQPEHVHIKTGQPATEIRAAAEAIQADLIVIGTHGRHGLGLLLGATANGVLHGVHCDVLTVRIHNEV